MFDVSQRMKVVLLASAVLMVLVAGCGSESPVANSADEVEVQQPVVAVTPSDAWQQIATSTPVPTSTPIPSPTPASYTTDGLTPIDLPPQLAYDAERLDSEQVIELWTTMISGARHYIMDGAIVVDTCADGTGRYLMEASRIGQTFTWEVKKDPGGRWSAARALVQFDDPSIGAGPDGATVIPLIVNENDTRVWPTYSKTFEAQTFVSPSCAT